MIRDDEYQKRDEVLHVSALILAGQSAYRADSQSKNLQAIVLVAKELICVVNEHCWGEDGIYDSTSPPLNTKPIPNSEKKKLNVPLEKRPKLSKKA